MLMDLEQWLLNVLNAMHATIQIVDVIVVIFSERFSISAIHFQVWKCYKIKALK